jgi:hypothetical protein
MSGIYTTIPYLGARGHMRLGTVVGTCIKCLRANESKEIVAAGAQWQVGGWDQGDINERYKTIDNGQVHVCPHLSAHLNPFKEIS